MAQNEKKPEAEKAEALSAEVKEAPKAAQAAEPAPEAPAPLVAEPASLMDPAAEAIQAELGRSLAEVTQSFANNQGFPCADAGASVNGDIIINTPAGMKTVRNLIPS